MARWIPEPWRDVAAGVSLGGIALVILLVPQTPAWLRAGIVALGMLGSVLPALAILALVPWHFVAIHRGLARRGASPCVVSVADGFLSVERGERRARLAIDAVARARLARNANWTESKMLEDALGLFSADGREQVRLPLSTGGLDGVLEALEARGVPVEDVEVSAPVWLD
jgi:hypothetical protein